MGARAIAENTVRSDWMGRGVDATGSRHLAIATTSAPPSSSGQATVLGRLLCGNPVWRVSYFSDEDIGVRDPCVDTVHVRTSQPHHLLVPGLGPFGKVVARINNRLGLARSIQRRAWEIRHALRSTPPAAIVGCSGDPFDLPAAHLAASRMKLPFIAYLFDDPAYQFPVGVYREIAHFWERRWLGCASALVVTNEVMAEDIVRRHPGARPVIVRNPIAGEVLPASEWRAPRPTGAPVRIVYTGSVYHAQGTAFQNLIAAMTRDPGRYRLEIFTSQPPRALHENGVVGQDVVHMGYIDSKRSIEVQKGADVLFLPLAFRSGISEVIRSSAPGKTGEYLSSGVPILVHAPRNSFISTFATDRNAAVVVDDDSVDAVARGLDEVSANVEARTRVSRGAWHAAAEFAQSRARREFDATVMAAIGGQG